MNPEQKELEFNVDKEGRPVECLGMTFENDAARREYFTDILREKLKDPEFRKIDGFPIGKDKDILALSDPPYYTACPNPFVGDFIDHYGKPYNPKVKYHREPFAADVSEGKNHPIYNAHSYHTKVPHKAIMRYILHYTEPGDIIFDGFCGTGMAGVAGRLCGDDKAVQDLGYRIQKDDLILNEAGKPFAKIGARHALLNELSPAATFIAYNFNRQFDANAFESDSLSILDDTERLYGWMFSTLDGATSNEINKISEEIIKCKTVDECRSLIHLLEEGEHSLQKANNKLLIKRINYTIISDIFVCDECGNEIIFWDVAVNHENWRVKNSFHCPTCNAKTSKRKIERQWSTQYDQLLAKSVRLTQRKPVLIHYRGKTQFSIKVPDAFDKAILMVIEKLSNLDGIPIIELPFGDKTSDPRAVGISYFHQFYTRRNLEFLNRYANGMGATRNFVNITSSALVLSMMYRFRSQNGSLGAGGGPMNGTMYVPSLIKEIPAPKILREHIKKTAKARRLLSARNCNIIQTSSHCGLSNISSDSIDYIFVDPPFGSNIMYSELNFLWEGWLRVSTNAVQEAIENRSQKKKLDNYKELMGKSFKQAYRILKPGRWMTIEFSNTKASVWNAIQTSLQEIGFVVANVAALNKKQGSFNAVTNPTSVKQDLVISAYKPNGGLEKRFLKKAHTEEGIWGFVRTHLNNLPGLKARGGQLEVITERDPRILYDRTVAYYIGHGFPVPLSSPQFQAGLAEKFPERDGMYFLPEQAAEYDKKRLQMEGLGQMSIWVEDERSATDWLRNYLKGKPSKYQDVMPEFFEQLNQSWKKWETKPELRALLDQYFLCYEGMGNVPPQIHSYLSTNFKDLRKLPADDPSLRAKAKDRWYVPDPKKNVDVEMLRDKRLLEEFWTYLPPGYHAESSKKGASGQQQKLPGMEKPQPKTPRGKKLKLVRTEAVRVGFKHCYQNKDYPTIIAVAHHIPDDVVNGDDQLQMIYDTAVTRSGGDF